MRILDRLMYKMLPGRFRKIALILHPRCKKNEQANKYVTQKKDSEEELKAGHERDKKLTLETLVNQLSLTQEKLAKKKAQAKERKA